MDPKKPLSLSIVVPVFNEENNLSELYEEILKSCKELDITYEIIFVDDGSWDASFPVLRSIQKEDLQVKIIRLRKNFGQTAALSAGFDYAKGEVIITLDADLQNDPQDFALLYEKIREGYDIVSGWRKKRKDRLLTRRIPSAIANWLISRITHIKLHDFGCTLKAFRKEVVKNINLYGELHRFIPAIASNIGVSIAEVVVNHRPRKHGKSKYTPRPSYSQVPPELFHTASSDIRHDRTGQRCCWRPHWLIPLLSTPHPESGHLRTSLIAVGHIARAYHESVDKRIYFVREISDSESEQLSE
jgi:glycosyltransferase involved in cell wall biosynthesis